MVGAQMKWENDMDNIKDYAKDHKKDHIIAGRFQTKAKADAAAAVLVRYIDRHDICIFHNNPPGQHGVLKMGGDEDHSPGTETAEEGAATAAVAAGLTAAAVAGAVGMVGGPVTALAAAGVAAYTGSLVGSLEGSDEGKRIEPLPSRRPAGIILAVRIARHGNEEFVVDDLRLAGAEDIEEAEGLWRDGDWVDFNPVQAPRLVAFGKREFEHQRVG